MAFKGIRRSMKNNVKVEERFFFFVDAITFYKFEADI